MADIDQVVSSLQRLKIKNKTAGLTPYQGPHRRWGEFKCPQCLKKWSSGNSWANKGQECRQCGIMVYPYVQRPLKRSTTVNTNRPHPEELCEKCKDLGYSCRNVAVYDYGYDSD